MARSSPSVLCYSIERPTGIEPVPFPRLVGMHRLCATVAWCGTMNFTEPHALSYHGSIGASRVSDASKLGPRPDPALGQLRRSTIVGRVSLYPNHFAAHVHKTGMLVHEPRTDYLPKYSPLGVGRECFSRFCYILLKKCRTCQ